MALLNVKASKKVEAIIRLEESTAKMIGRYAAFLKVPADEVVDKGMEFIFSKDKEFQQHLEQEPNAQASNTLRLKKPQHVNGTHKNGARNSANNITSAAKTTADVLRT